VKSVFKLIAVALTFIGIAANFADLRGCFQGPQRQAFAELVITSSEPIPRDTAGFEAFLEAFPPPSGISPSDVTHIADKTLRWDSASDVGTTVAYLASGSRTAAVARFDEINAWANASIYGWLSLSITFIGWAIYAGLEISDLRSSRRSA
jgi:hypothetical protein